MCTGNEEEKHKDKVVLGSKNNLFSETNFES
jgi:hypothetical protein